MERTGTIFYIIDIEYKGALWTLEKRYSQIRELQDKLKKKFKTIPSLPGKTMGKITNPHKLNNRRLKLQEFLIEIIKQEDLRNSEEVRSFLQIDENASEINLQLPSEIKTLISPFKMGVGFMIHVPEKEMLIVAENNMQAASRGKDIIGSIFSSESSKMGSVKALAISYTPPSSQTQQTQQEEGQGQAQTEPQNHTQAQDEEGKGLEEEKEGEGEDASKGQFHYKLLWELFYDSMVGCIYFHEYKSLLGVGLDKGGVSFYRIDELNQYHELFSYTPHSARVRGLAHIQESNLIISIGEDKKMILTDVNTMGELNNLKVGDSALTNLFLDPDHQRIFLTNKSGILFIYDTKQSPPLLKCSIQCTKKGYIRVLKVDLKNNLIFCGFDDGYIAMLELEEEGKEQFTKQINSFDVKENLRAMTWRASKGELIVGNRKGQLRFINVNKNSSFLAFSVHKSSIKDILYLPGSEIVITSSKDKSLSFWKLPDTWSKDPGAVKSAETEEDKKVEEQEKEKEKDKEELEEKLSTIKVAEGDEQETQKPDGVMEMKDLPMKKYEYGSDDDLAGWDES
jgi:WD40 repeat protein